jgi:predicted PurR-regulated permease PerM
MTTPRRLAPPPLRVLTATLVLGSVIVLAPFWPWLLLSAWFALASRKLISPLMRLTRGRHRAAAVLTVGLVIGILVPLVLVVVPLAFDAVGVVRKLSQSADAKLVLQKLVVPGEGDAPKPGTLPQLLDLVTQHGVPAWSVVSAVLVAAGDALLGIFVLVMATYAGLVEGERAWQWLETNAPIEPAALRRMGHAFSETGRGLFIGIGGAALAQSSVATVLYAALGVPRPLVLGLLTLIVSVIPSIGTALVWGPIALGLALTGRTGAAAILVGMGVVVIGSLDNILKPMLAKWGHLQLPSVLVLVGMLGGFVVVGPWGLLLGPLVLRLAGEAIAISRAAESTLALPNEVGSE